MNTNTRNTQDTPSVQIESVKSTTTEPNKVGLRFNPYISSELQESDLRDSLASCLIYEFLKQPCLELMVFHREVGEEFQTDYINDSGYFDSRTDIPFQVVLKEIGDDLCLVPDDEWVYGILRGPVPDGFLNLFDYFQETGLINDIRDKLFDWDWHIPRDTFLHKIILTPVDGVDTEFVKHEEVVSTYE